MKKNGKKSIEASFVEGKSPSKSPTPKSLTPKVKTAQAKTRVGKNSKKVPY